MSNSKTAPFGERLQLAASLVSELSGGVTAATRILGSAADARLRRIDPAEVIRGSRTEPPVMLVHGLGSDSSIFRQMSRELHLAGYTVYAVNYSCVDVDLATCGRYLAAEAAWLRSETGSDRVHVVAHSLGGVALRFAVANTAMGRSVDVAVTLGSPHRGTPIARLAPWSLPGFGRVIRELRPGLPTRHDAPGSGVRWVSIAGQYDWVAPPTYARLPDSENVRNEVVSGGGHLALPKNEACLRIILDELRTAERVHRQSVAA